MKHRVQELNEQGQSVWLDYISRQLLASGTLEMLIRDGIVRGVTSNPTIFNKAITGSDDYEQALVALARGGVRDPYEAFVALGAEDIRIAADLLRPVYDASEGADGFVSFEVQDADTETMVREAHALFDRVGRPNVMIKIPGTRYGIGAIERLIADGVNVNTTLLFSVRVYEQAANAYIAGLERRLADGRPLDRVAGVASFFVSRIDTKVDALLPEGSSLRGQVAIANARLAYQRFREIFAGERWQRLARAGARVQRPLWASTGTKNPAYSDVLYIEELVAPDTVNTLPEATLQAFLDHGRVEPTWQDWARTAPETLAAAAAEGIDLEAVTEQLLEEGLASFRGDFQKLLQALAVELAAAPGKAYYLAGLGALAAAVESRLDRMSRERVTGRIWEHDHTLWSEDPTEITRPNRLGWLTIADSMSEQCQRLQRFAAEAAAEGFESALVLGMGGSSLAAEVLARTFPVAAGRLRVQVLDSTDPETIADSEARLDLERTLFVIASKSGTTVETLSHFAYFWQQRPEGRRFVAITDPGTPLETLARERGFREVFLNPPDIGGRYSALSFFGLVPAALAGIDLERLLAGAEEMARACRPYVPVRDNPGALLGAVLGEAALSGRDKLTLLLPPEAASLGAWLEQLIAESTGKQGKGILPVVGEAILAPEGYGSDRLFVSLGEHEAVPGLIATGQPLLQLPFRGAETLGGEFFRWEFATAVAGYVLGINPFDQPDVEAAKRAAVQALQERRNGGTRRELSLRGLAELVRPGDYIAVQAYLPQLLEVEEALDQLRLALGRRFHVATTVGFGPRYLHSTGQLHKGGPDEGIFLQLLGGDGRDLPVPGHGFSFGELKRAQAAGDAAALRAKGARLLRFDLGAAYLEGVRRLTKSLA